MSLHDYEDEQARQRLADIERRRTKPAEPDAIDTASPEPALTLPLAHHGETVEAVGRRVEMALDAAMRETPPGIIVVAAEDTPAEPSGLMKRYGRAAERMIRDDSNSGSQELTNYPRAMGSEWINFQRRHGR